jgi:hypothetical protein
MSYVEPLCATQCRSDAGSIIVYDLHTFATGAYMIHVEHQQMS